MAESYIYHILPADRVMDLLYRIVVKEQKADVDQDFLFRFCFANSGLPKAWSISLSLLTLAVVNVEAALELRVSRFNVLILPHVLLMASLLVAVCVSLPADSFWNQLLKCVLDLLTNSLEKIPLSAFGDAFQNSAVQLLSFGLLRPIQVAFPFAPAASDEGEIAEVALKSGQPFPQASPPHAPFAPLEAIETDAQLSDRLRDLLADLLPDKIELLPGVSVDSPGQGVDFLSRAIASNLT
jgi:hypothetical protein